MSAAGPPQGANSAPSGGSEAAPVVSAASVGAQSLALVRLLQLASPALPIGAYSYSQGLEWAVEAGIVRDATTAQAWIGDLMEYSIGPGEAAVLGRCMTAMAADDAAAFIGWNAWFRASRETAELRAETEQTGGALCKLLGDLNLLEGSARSALESAGPVTLPAAFAVAAHASGVDPPSAMAGYLWAWIENQVLAAMKSMPLGQVGGQRVLHALGARIPAVVVAARALDDADVASFAPGMALASTRHETQYSRLFRS